MPAAAQGKPSTTSGVTLPVPVDVTVPQPIGLSMPVGVVVTGLVTGAVACEEDPPPPPHPDKDKVIAALANRKTREIWLDEQSMVKHSFLISYLQK